ncbi:hypothetical protein OROMI_031464 [Orobanche minor]
MEMGSLKLHFLCKAEMAAVCFFISHFKIPPSLHSYYCSRGYRRSIIHAPAIVYPSRLSIIVPVQNDLSFPLQVRSLYKIRNFIYPQVAILSAQSFSTFMPQEFTKYSQVLLLCLRIQQFC